MLQVATVFSGIGAFEHALERMNVPHSVVFASDIDKYAKQSYLLNYNAENWYDNVKDIDGSKYRDQIDVFVGGSPCQSFSINGKRKGFSDTRGTLFYEYIRLIDEIRPKVFIYENVKGVYNHDNGQTWDIMKESFAELGYTFYHQILNAKDYNVPQNRERVFVVGFKDKVDFSFPDSKKLEILLEDVLDDTTEEKYYFSIEEEKKIEFMYNHSSKTGLKQIGTTGKYQSDRIYDSRGICPCLLAGDSRKKIYHNKRFRYLTPVDALKLMGYKSFICAVSDTQLYKQAGNSIVVDVLMHIVHEIDRSMSYFLRDNEVKETEHEIYDDYDWENDDFPF